jgi:hypothetical protein
MKPSEKLLLLLELNGFDVSNIRIKKQLEYEQNGNVNIYRYYKFSDIIESHYEYENSDILNRNPLNYHSSWKKTAKSIDQFFIVHPEIGPGVTLKEFINAKQIDPEERERIIHEIIEGWIDESRNLQGAKIQAITDAVSIMSAEDQVFKKPSRFLMLIAFLFAIVMALITVVPLFVDVSVVTDAVPYLNDYIALTNTTSWYLYLGYGVLGISLIYAILNLSYSRSIKKKTTIDTDKLFDRLDRDLKYQQFLQSKEFNEYVKLVIKKPHKSALKITNVLAPNIFVADIKAKIMDMMNKYDGLSRKYSRQMSFIKWMFILAFLAFIGFAGIGYGVIGGYVSV